VFERTGVSAKKRRAPDRIPRKSLRSSCAEVQIFVELFVSIGPALTVCDPSADTATSTALPKKTAQTHADPAIEIPEGGTVPVVLEVGTLNFSRERH
jgi:hypothetical protein